MPIILKSFRHFLKIPDKKQTSIAFPGNSLLAFSLNLITQCVFSEFEFKRKWKKPTTKSKNIIDNPILFDVILHPKRVLRQEAKAFDKWILQTNTTGMSALPSFELNILSTTVLKLRFFIKGLVFKNS